MLKKYNITSSQFKILLYLYKNNVEETKQIDLERVFLLKNPTMTGILQRLEKNNFITRRKSEKDGRSNIVILTDKSIALEEELREIGNKLEEIITNGVSKDELEIAYKLLDKFLNNIL